MHEAEHGPWDLMRIIDSIANNVPRDYLVNVANKGAIAGLPDDFAVEVPVMIDGSGVHRKDMITLPQKVFFGAILPHWIQTERYVESYRSRDIGMLWQTYMADHKITSLEQASELVQTLLNMPGNEEMKEHYSVNPIGPYTNST
jgi:alpha-galactosidase/6-phospho-beta-glucosidase family protein